MEENTQKELLRWLKIRNIMQGAADVEILITLSNL